MSIPSSIPRAFMAYIIHSFYCHRLLSFHVNVSCVLCYELLKGRDHILDFFALCFTYNMDYFNDYYGNNSDDAQLRPFAVPAWGGFVLFSVSNANCHKFFKFINIPHDWNKLELLSKFAVLTKILILIYQELFTKQ